MGCSPWPATPYGVVVSRSSGRGGEAEVPIELTSFVGRDAEINAVHAALGQARVLTLVGPGGVGKTRLAMRVAAEARREALTIVRWVTLSALEPATELPVIEDEVARGLGVLGMPVRSWSNALGGSPAVGGHGSAPGPPRVLLVMDNCEHVLEATGALVTRLLDSAPGVQVLVTSREPLGCLGERLLVVPPMSYPASGHGVGARSPERFESMALFSARAAAAGVPVADHQWSTAAELCRRLDGLPLAIELAVAGLRIRSLEEIVTDLGESDSRFGLLTGGPRHGGHPMHHSLRTAVDWSYQLCSPAERVLWARLSVFEGSWDLAAAERVCADSPGDASAALRRGEVRGLVARLVEKSIVTADTSGSRTRYYLLQSLRRYGQDRAERSGEHDLLRRRHRDYYLGVVADLAHNWPIADGASWLSDARSERSNLRAALDWSVSVPGEGAAGLEMALDLARITLPVWSSSEEPLVWLEKVLAIVSREGSSDELRVQAMALAGCNALLIGSRDDGADLVARCREAAASLSSPHLRYVEGVHLFVVCGDPRSVEVLTKAVAAFDRAGPRFAGDRLMAVITQACASAWFSEREAALGDAQSALDEATAAGASWAQGWAMSSQAIAVRRHVDPLAAITLHRRVLDQQRRSDPKYGVTWSVHYLAWAHAEVLRAAHQESSGRAGARTGQHAEALYIARLLGAAAALRARNGMSLRGNALVAAANSTAERLVREQLAAAGGDCAAAGDFEAAFDEGSILTMDEVLSLATTGPGESDIGTAAPTWRGDSAEATLWFGLTDAEQQVASLAARGLTNSQIAHQRFSSVRTVEKHLESIRRKLLIGSRSEIASRMP